MPSLPSYIAMTVMTAVIAVPVLAQQTVQTAPAASPPANSELPGVVATTNNPNLAVASVKLENGSRVSKLIGTAVYGDGNQQVGSVEDLIMTGGDKITVAVVSVGGFLGLGSKLVAFPFDQLKFQDGRAILAGVTKDSLNAMPNFQY